MLVDKSGLWCRVLVARYGEEAGRLGEGGRNGSAWWREIVRSGRGGRCGREGVVYGEYRTAGREWCGYLVLEWLGGAPLSVKYRRLFDLSLDKLRTVVEIYMVVEARPWWWLYRSGRLHSAHPYGYCGRGRLDRSYLAQIGSHKGVRLGLTATSKQVTDERQLGDTTYYNSRFSSMCNGLRGSGNGTIICFSLARFSHLCGACLELSIWVVWHERNNRIFKAKESTVHQMLEKVKVHSLWWMKAYNTHLSLNSHMWWSSPFVCLGID
ncbi:hypothetical protein TSUD_279370 [Trifolium subterraneum]|uniref:Uncharacterized protein n=1 Tax=Trifolium subterraneum TaxID=3900 RepID=A0A2Z6MU03_TRISU|nr:hypothetical protein TSUD_279370 [Trifolium subterraneum]